MKLITKIPVSRSNHLINYHSRIVSFGSCFAEEVGKKFEYFKFNHFTNPFGILFQPLAIEKVVDFALSEKQFTQDDIFFLNERWHCFAIHSTMSHPDKDIMLTNLNNTLKTTRQSIFDATHFIVTLGTAWVYKHIESNEIVANCHKVPQKAFEKRLLSIDEITAGLENLVSRVKAINPEINFIFTISPVRHLKDGFVENQISKAHLIAALQSFLNIKNSPLLWRGAGSPTLKSFSDGAGEDYFPSYEILIDELRDYRFYAEDLVHPNQLAIDYIWNRFAEVYFSEETFFTMKEVDTIQKGLAHKPFNPKSENHLKFLKKLEYQIEQLQKKFTQIKF
jgi:hypothetical protein